VIVLQAQQARSRHRERLSQVGEGWIGTIVEVRAIVAGATLNIAALVPLPKSLRITESANMLVANPDSIEQAARGDFEKPRRRNNGSSRTSTTRFDPCLAQPID
jgi:hypothetical protein